MIGDRDSSELITKILNTFQDAVVWIDTNSCIVEWNTAAERLFGFKRNDVMGRSLTNTIVPDQHRNAHRNGMAKFMETGRGAIFGRTVNINAMHWSGHEIQVAISIDSIAIANVKYFTAHIRELEDQSVVSPETTPIAEVVAESGMDQPLELMPLD